MSKHQLLESEAVVELAQHISVVAFHSASGRRKVKPPRSGCSQIALQVLLVGHGLRRAALVDALSLSAAQASAISEALDSLSKQAHDESVALREVRLLYHAATSQTFIVSTRDSLWNDIASLKERSLQQSQSYPVLWVDARSTPQHNAPTATTTDTHTTQLIEAISEAVQRESPGNALVIFQPDQARIDTEEFQLVGVALAGLLLEYGAVYCLHKVSPSQDVEEYHNEVRPLKLKGEPTEEASFSASPTNCLGSQPLMLYRVTWSHHTDKMELLAFSVPERLSSEGGVEHLHEALTETFRSRLTRIDSVKSSAFARELSSGSISVDLTTVTLPQVAL